METPPSSARAPRRGQPASKEPAAIAGRGPGRGVPPHTMREVVAPRACVGHTTRARTYTKRETRLRKRGNVPLLIRQRKGECPFFERYSGERRYSSSRSESTGARISWNRDSRCRTDGLKRSRGTDDHDTTEARPAAAVRVWGRVGIAAALRGGSGVARPAPGRKSRNNEHELIRALLAAAAQVAPSRTA